MTTIQKFEEALTVSGGELDALNASEDVIVLVDEAHRTQYGILGGRMSSALPNAVLVGFTGTPIEKVQTTGSDCRSDTRPAAWR